MKKISLFLFLALFSGCATAPKGVAVVSGFEIERYLGVWHEVARLDHSFERGLVSVTAEYSMRADGGISVRNRGFDKEKNKWKEVVGKAYFRGDRSKGGLKVSFFGPFYGGYNIIDLDSEKYEYAMVCGPNRKYLWILSRKEDLPQEVLQKLLVKASALGFETDKFIFPGK